MLNNARSIVGLKDTFLYAFPNILLLLSTRI